MHDYAQILNFWFVEHDKDDWFAGDEAFDRAIAERFADIHRRVAMGEAYEWRTSADGRLAEIIVLDQFSRQLHRGEARAFAQDPMALALAQEAVARGLDQAFEAQRRMFLYMPYMHSESLVVHEQAMQLFTSLGDPEVLKFEEGHRDVISRFGRYPFRNEALGRSSSEEELAYMKEHADRVF
ncbi:membrane protein [Devosia pacifica]|uniref:Membrane protein n=1 Tax=Devosia pacifica TaxID=1335967 RepID=A0A918S9H5_9HYPH|nr:DUF924 family protein [Devosia pacifica]GHA31630.1 membrane protein [Devosia pacifica]